MPQMNPTMWIMFWMMLLLFSLIMPLTYFSTLSYPAHQKKLLLMNNLEWKW